MKQFQNMCIVPKSARAYMTQISSPSILVF